MKVKLLDCSDRSTVKNISHSIKENKNNKTVLHICFGMREFEIALSAMRSPLFPPTFFQRSFTLYGYVVGFCIRNAPLYLDVLMPCCSPHVLLMALVFFFLVIFYCFFIFQTNPFLREAKLLQE